MVITIFTFISQFIYHFVAFEKFNSKPNFKIKGDHKLVELNRDYILKYFIITFIKFYNVYYKIYNFIIKFYKFYNKHYKIL